MRPFVGISSSCFSVYEAGFGVLEGFLSVYMYKDTALGCFYSSLMKQKNAGGQHI